MSREMLFSTIGCAAFVVWMAWDGVQALCVITNLGNRLTALEDYIRADNRFQKWRKARPFLYVGQCPYAQALVKEMINAWERLRVCNEQYHLNSKSFHEEGLRALYQLLEEQPPHKPPPTGRRLYFCFI
jgi:hypothetical protein